MIRFYLTNQKCPSTTQKYYAAEKPYTEGKEGGTLQREKYIFNISLI